MRSDSNVGITSLRVHTERVGLGMILGPLELQIMQALWEGDGRPATNKEIQLTLHRAGSTLAIPTIGTTMHRLATKGLVRQSRISPRVYGYEPLMSEDALEAYVVEHILARLRDEWPLLMHKYDLGEMVFNDC